MAQAEWQIIVPRHPLSIAMSHTTTATMGYTYHKGKHRTLMKTTQNREQQPSEFDVMQHRRLPVGRGGASRRGSPSRVWASKRRRVEVVLEGGPGGRPGAEPLVVALEPGGGGVFLRAGGQRRRRDTLWLPARWRDRILRGPGLALSARRPARPLASHRSTATFEWHRPRLARRAAGGASAL